MGSSNNDLRSRRAVLTGAVVGVAAVAVGKPQGVHAADGDPVLIGQTNSAQSGTSISRTDVQTNVTLGGLDYAIAANSHVAQGEGVIGSVTGNSGRGVVGETSGHFSQIGVDADTLIGNGEGIAVRARTRNGAGVWAEATGGGHALHVRGRAIFSRSGRVAFNQGQASKTISNQYVGQGALVLATIQGDVAGAWVRGVSLDIPNERFVIRLNKAAPKRLVVGWFIVN